MTGDIIIDNNKNVVGITLSEVPQDGKLAIILKQSRLLTSLIPSDIVPFLLKNNQISTDVSKVDVVDQP